MTSPAGRAAATPKRRARPLRPRVPRGKLRPMARRRKFWGWGFEDQQPPDDHIAAAAAGARERLGFPPAEVERPVTLDDIELRPARLEPPAALGHMCTTDRYE